MTKIREGYKETEIGIIPEDWECTELGIVTELIDGDRGKNYPSPNEIVESGVLFLSTSNIVNNKFDLTNTKFITKEKFELLRKGKLSQKDLIITLRGTLGSIMIFESKTYDTAFINAQMMIIRTNREKIEYRFLYEVMTSLNIRNQIVSESTGSAQPQLTKKVVVKLRIPLPSLIEQQKIAEILSTTDEHIEKLDKIIEYYKLLKKGMVQKLLTKGIGHTEFKDSEIGRIPKEWEIVNLSNITLFIKDGSHGSHKDVENGIPLLSAKDIIFNKIQIPTDCRRISHADYDKLHKNYEIQKGDVLLTIVGTIGRTAIVEKAEEKFTLQRSVGIIRPNEKVNSDYMKQYFNASLFQKQLKKSVNASAQGGIYLKTLSNLNCILPQLSEQQSIAEILSAIDGKIDMLHFEKDDFILLKKSLMQKLLTGEIRINS